MALGQPCRWVMSQSGERHFRILTLDTFQNAQVNAFVAGFNDAKKMAILHAIYGMWAVVLTWQYNGRRLLIFYIRHWRALFTTSRDSVRNHETLVVSLLYASRSCCTDDCDADARFQIQDTERYANNHFHAFFEIPKSMQKCLSRVEWRSGRLIRILRIATGKF